MREILLGLHKIMIKGHCINKYQQYLQSVVFSDLNIQCLCPTDGRPFSEIYARQLISKISREELEDKYLRLQEDNQVQTTFCFLLLGEVLQCCKSVSRTFIQYWQCFEHFFFFISHFKNSRLNYWTQNFQNLYIKVSRDVCCSYLKLNQVKTF